MVGLLGGWVDGGWMRLINYGLEFVWIDLIALLGDDILCMCLYSKNQRRSRSKKSAGYTDMSASVPALSRTKCLRCRVQYIIMYMSRREVEWVISQYLSSRFPTGSSLSQQGIPYGRSKRCGSHRVGRAGQVYLKIDLGSTLSLIALLHVVCYSMASERWGRRTEFLDVFVSSARGRAAREGH